LDNKKSYPYPLGEHGCGVKAKELFMMRQSGKKKRSKEEITLELLNSSLRQAEAILVRTVLEETDWNISQAARELHIPRGTLYSKMQKHDIQRPT
jgi:DNA-binding NtrC family response regulator